MEKTLFVCDSTGVELTVEETTTFDVVCPLAGASYAAGELDIDNALTPSDVPEAKDNGVNEPDRTTIFVEGDAGIGGARVYPRIIGIAIGDGGTDGHARTYGRERAIDEWGVEFIAHIERALRERHVREADQGMYEESTLEISDTTQTEGT